MATSTMNPTRDGGCVLWTPWGPQTASDPKPQLSSLRQTLRKLTAAKSRKQGGDSAFIKPECAYEP
ncbi:MAG: hypothetical protein M9924_14315 [Rhizobiaceae bacterium]|nr:hypothetical protein [Rhizobiaceae bacterium]